MGSLARPVCARYHRVPCLDFASNDYLGLAASPCLVKAVAAALIGLDMITDSGRRREIVNRFERAGRRVIGLTNAQI